MRRSFSVKISNPMSGGVISSNCREREKAHASSSEMGKTMEVPFVHGGETH